MENKCIVFVLNGIFWQHISCGGDRRGMGDKGVLDFIFLETNLKFFEVTLLFLQTPLFVD